MQTCTVSGSPQLFINTASFAIPGCDLALNVPFRGITVAPLNGYIWTAGIGYLQITNYNPVTGELQLTNPCIEVCDGGAVPGTPVPACTAWILTPPPCGASAGPSNLYPYLNSGFVAPDDGDCLDIAVTNVNGLSVGKNIAINGGTYRIQAILSGVLITICNDGAGLTPGTVVDYKDAAGNLIVPIVLIDSNPCTNTAVLEGVPIVCDAGVMVPLEGSENGQVLVWDTGTETASFRTLGIPVLNCTELTACLTLDPTNPPGSDYLVQVEDTSDYTVGDIVTIGGTQFEVITIDSATQMHIQPLIDPVVVQTYNAGQVLCSADCCSRIERIEAMVLDNDAFTCAGTWLDNQVLVDDAAAIVPTSLTAAGTTSVNGNEAEIEITNPSCINSLRVHIVVNSLFVHTSIGADGTERGTTMYLAVDEDTGVLVDVYVMPETYKNTAISGGSATDNIHSHSASFSFVDTIAPLATATYRARAAQNLGAGDTTSLLVSTLAVRMTAQAVGVIV